MSERTIVVAIDTDIDNFSVLGLRHSLDDGKVDVLIHNTPEMNVDGTEVKYNFDILITGGRTHRQLLDTLPPHRCVKLPRYTKSVQAAKLLLAAQTGANFMPVPTWSVGWGGRNYPKAQERMVVKPNDGARGIGQFVINTLHVNLDYFLKALKQLVDGEHTQELLDAFVKRFEGHVSYHAGASNHPLEGLEALKGDGVVVQSVIENIAHEYRILTDRSGCPVYFQERKLRDQESSYPQATGSGSVIDRKSVTEYYDLPACVDRSFFEHLCQQVIGPMNSIDLFITHDGKWGIFEYCNQFGISGVCQEIAYNLHSNCMQSVVEKYLS